MFNQSFDLFFRNPSICLFIICDLTIIWDLITAILFSSSLLKFSEGFIDKGGRETLGQTNRQTKMAREREDLALVVFKTKQSNKPAGFREDSLWKSPLSRSRAEKGNERPFPEIPVSASRVYLTYCDKDEAPKKKKSWIIYLFIYLSVYLLLFPEDGKVFNNCIITRANLTNSFYRRLRGVPTRGFPRRFFPSLTG